MPAQKIGQHREVGEAGVAPAEAVGFVAAVGDDIATKRSTRRFNCGKALAGFDAQTGVLLFDHNFEIAAAVWAVFLAAALALFALLAQLLRRTAGDLLHALLY